MTQEGEPLSGSALPRVTVLLATHNGLTWLPEQLGDILGQTGVRVQVVALDDMSTDGTFSWLQEQAAADPRVRVLPQQGASGSAAANFYRLLAHVDPDDPATGLIAFADQDDRWHPDKLAGQVALLTDRTRALDGISSNVMSFDAAGNRELIKKDYPQRAYDYLLESPGPGCTFVLSPRLARRCREVLADPSGVAASTAFHDWLVYGVCRGAGWNWLIQSDCTVDYRQHDNNSFGANSGARSALSRLRLIVGRWHRGEAIKMAEVALTVAPAESRADLQVMLDLLRRGGPRRRIALARRADELRRRPRDRKLIAAMVLVGLW